MNKYILTSCDATAVRLLHGDKSLDLVANIFMLNSSVDFTLLSKRSIYVEFIAVCYVVKNIAKYFDILLLFSFYFLLFVALQHS